MAKVEARQNIFFSQDLGVSREWKQSFTELTFQPDEVIVRSIAYKFEGKETGVSYIFTDLVDEGFLGSFMDGFINNPNQTFRINKKLTGAYLFQVKDPTTQAIDIGQGYLSISLEFVKYSK